MSALTMVASLLAVGPHLAGATFQCGHRGLGCSAASAVQIGIDANYPNPSPDKYVPQTEAPRIAANGFVIVRVSAGNTSTASPSSTNPSCNANEPTVSDFSNSKLEVDLLIAAGGPSSGSDSNYVCHGDPLAHTIASSFTNNDPTTGESKLNVPSVDNPGARTPDIGVGETIYGDGVPAHTTVVAVAGGAHPDLVLSHDVVSARFQSDEPLTVMLPANELGITGIEHAPNGLRGWATSALNYYEGNCIIGGVSVCPEVEVLNEPAVMSNFSPSFTLSGDGTNGRSGLNVMSNVVPNGDFVSGNGIPSDTIVSAGGGSTHLRLSKALTSNVTNEALSFQPQIVAIAVDGSTGKTRATVKIDGILRGDEVTGKFVQPHTTVAYVRGESLVLSRALKAGFRRGDFLTFTSPASPTSQANADAYGKLLSTVKAVFGSAGLGSNAPKILGSYDGGMGIWGLTAWGGKVWPTNRFKNVGGITVHDYPSNCSDSDAEVAHAHSDSGGAASIYVTEFGWSTGSCTPMEQANNFCHYIDHIESRGYNVTQLMPFAYSDYGVSANWWGLWNFESTPRITMATGSQGSTQLSVLSNGIEDGDTLTDSAGTFATQTFVVAGGGTTTLTLSAPLNATISDGGVTVDAVGTFKPAWSTINEAILGASCYWPG
jgi:hypothetical protein